MSGRSDVLAAALLVLLLGSRWSWAASVYVIDTLAVGMHEDKQLDSPIIKVIPTGTPLEVLATEGNLMQVKTEEGIVGWVDATYVMEEKPAQLALLELEASYSEAQDQLRAAREEVAVLNDQVDRLEKVKQEQDASGEGTTDTRRDIDRLAEENQVLKDQLQKAHVALATEASPGVTLGDGGDAKAPDARSGNLGLTTWHWIMIAALMLLSFGFGAYLVDLSARRRHGGFRV